MADRVDVGSIRRAQIVEAATRVIARKGFHNASISEIEQEAGVSRGVITYHFPSKEDLVLAVFDAMIDRVRRATAPCPVDHLAGCAVAERVIEWALTERPDVDEFDCLHYTFLALILHRPDFRRRMAALYAGMRDHFTAYVAEEVREAGSPPCDVGAVGTIVISALHGLIMQQNADPDAIDCDRLLGVLRAMVRGYLADPTRGQDRKKRPTPRKRQPSR